MKMNITEIWNHIENNKTIHWHNRSYRVLKTTANLNSGYQKNHFSYKNGNILIVRHEQGYQSILNESDLKDLYII
jgi:hypothetical protein